MNLLKKWQESLQKKQQELQQKEQLRKAQAYYKLVKAGNVFVKFVQEDLKKNGEQVNRHMRRRMETELNKKGVLSPELVDYYAQKIDYILMNINQRLNPPKVQQQIKDDVQIKNTKPEEVK